MLKKIACVALVMSLTVVAAQAAPIMRLTIDAATGAATLTSVSTDATPAEALTVDGYTILSADGEGGNISLTGWLSIEDSLATNVAGVIASLGLGGLGFAEVDTVSSIAITELTSGDGGIFQPGAPWGIGNPIVAGAATVEDLTFNYHINGEVEQRAGELVIIPVPEPATMSLLVFGGLGVLHRRKRR